MLQKFLPDHFIKNYAKIKAEQFIRAQGFVVFADLSGFTAMSEKLALKGLEGAEEISRILNRIFERIITILNSSGGSVYKFGGDAVTVFFPAEKCTAEKVLLAAMQVIQAMTEYQQMETISGKCEINIKIGIASGRVIIGQVGFDQLDYFIAGEALDQACICEHNSKKNEIVVNREFFVHSTAEHFREINESCLLLILTAEQQQRILAAEKKESNSIITESSIKNIHLFSRSILLDREKTGEIEKGELRNCTVIFLSFDGIDYGDNFNYPLLNEFYILTADLVNKYGGFINKIDLGDKGSKIIILFGAPVARENNEELALRLVGQIRENLPSGISIRIGINSGGIYFGVIGSENRQEFTVIGSTVNLSARLMSSAAENEILFSEYVKNRFSSCECSSMRLLQLKGIKEPYPAYTFYNIGKEQKVQNILLIGCENELALYRDILSVNQQQTRVVIIKAEAGLGKSVLASRFQEMASAKQNTVLASCLSYTQNSPFYLIGRLVERFWQLKDTDSPQVKIKALENALRPTGKLEFSRALASFLDWQTEKSPVVYDDSLKDFYNSILLDIFYREMVINRQIVFVEDLHWADQASLDFLQRLLNYLTGDEFLLHLIYRPEDKLTVFEKSEQVEVIELNNLDKKAAELYLKQKFSLVEIPLNLFREVFNKTYGNPFFMEEIFIALKQENWFIPQPVQKNQLQQFKIRSGIKEVQIPENLNDIILSRIDKLDINSKNLLKIASVVGRSFHYNILQELQNLEILLKQINLKDKLQNLSDVEITFSEKLIEQQYFFKHVITQEVAYGTILYSLKRKYHADIASIYESGSQLNQNDATELLAFHYRLSGLKEKTRYYLLQSARKAMQKFAYTEALNSLALYKKSKPPKDDLINARFLEVEICRALEKRQQGILICKNIRKRYTADSLYYQQSISKESDLLRRSSRFDEAIELIDQQNSFFNPEIELECRLNRSIALLMTGQIERFESEKDFLQNNCRKIKNNPLLWCKINEINGFYLLMQKRELSAANQVFSRNLKIARRHNLKTQEFVALQNIGTCHAQAGEYSQAKTIYLEICREAKKISNFDLLITGISNLAKIAFVTGEFKAAEQKISEGLKLAARFKKDQHRDKLLETQASIYLERGFQCEKRSDQHKLYKQALKICSIRSETAEKNNDQTALLYIRDVEADAYFRLDDFQKALQLNLHNLQKALELKDIERIGHAYGNLGNCYAELDNYSEAIDYYQKQLVYARKYHDPQSEGKALFNIGYTWKNNLLDTLKAKKFFLKAENIFQTIGYADGLQAVRAQLEN